MSFLISSLGRSVALLVLCGVITVRAQSLVGDYQLQDVYTSSVGTIGPLVVTGNPGGVSFQTATVDAQTQQVLSFQTTGLDLLSQSGVQAQTNPFLDSTNYSVVLLADFQIAATTVLATKVMDFKNLSSDAGLYINSATGILEFIDGTGILQGQGGAPLPAGTYIQLALTRDSATNLLSVYSNGALAFSFTDTNGLATLGDATPTGNAFLTVFQDDGGGLGGTTLNEASLGDVARLRLYDGALSGAQVSALDRVVPEPSSATLITLSLALFGMRGRRRMA